MSQNPRSQHNRRGSDSEQERGDNEMRSNNISNQHMRPRDEEDVERGRGGRMVEWTSRLLAIDYDRNAE
jgi:hypothetical protein